MCACVFQACSGVHVRASINPRWFTVAASRWITLTDKLCRYLPSSKPVHREWQKEKTQVRQKDATYSHRKERCEIWSDSIWKFGTTTWRIREAGTKTQQPFICSHVRTHVETTRLHLFLHKHHNMIHVSRFDQIYMKQMIYTMKLKYVLIHGTQIRSRFLAMNPDVFSWNVCQSELCWDYRFVTAWRVESHNVNAAATVASLYDGKQTVAERPICDILQVKHRSKDLRFISSTLLGGVDVRPINLLNNLFHMSGLTWSYNLRKSSVRNKSNSEVHVSEVIVNVHVHMWLL